MRQMVTRSTATLDSLKGWSSVELSMDEDGGLVQAPDALDLQVIDEILRPSSMVRKTAIIAGLAAVVVLQPVGYAHVRKPFDWYRLTMESSSRLRRFPL